MTNSLLMFNSEAFKVPRKGRLTERNQTEHLSQLSEEELENVAVVLAVLLDDSPR